MMNIFKATILFVLLASLYACRIDAAYILKSEGDLILYQYTYDKIAGGPIGSPIKKTTILKDSPTYNLLVSWMKKNESGWSPSPVTYAPNDMVSGQKFNLNFAKTAAILNFQGPDGKWHQYVKDIKEEDYQFLLK